MNRFTEIKNLVIELESDFEKFYDKNNAAAGTRVRKGMQDVKNMAHEIRVQVQELKNNTEAPAPAPKAKAAAPKAAAAKAPAKKK